MRVLPAGLPAGQPSPPTVRHRWCLLARSSVFVSSKEAKVTVTQRGAKFELERDYDKKAAALEPW